MARGNDWWPLDEGAIGDIPVQLAGTDRVIVRYRDHSVSKVRIAGDLRWHHVDQCDDIVAWKFSHHEPA